MHKQSHQNTHPTFTYRKGRIFYFRRKIPSDLRLSLQATCFCSVVEDHFAIICSEGRNDPVSAFG